jgi:hypothetical protein
VAGAEGVRCPAWNRHVNRSARGASAELVPSALFAVLLSFFGLESVFATMGVAMLAIGLIARYLPRAL